MATLLTLPRELRQKILKNFIGDELMITLSSPQVMTTLQVCRILREDAQWILGRCSHYFHTPSTFQKFLSYEKVPETEMLIIKKTRRAAWLERLRHILITIFKLRAREQNLPEKKEPLLPYSLLGYAPNLTSITLAIFNDSDPHVLLCTSTVGYYLYPNDHPELIAAWQDVVSSLPSGVKEVNLDITPAPGWMRRGYPDWIHTLIQDKRNTKKFIPVHRKALNKLVTRIYEVNPGIVVKFTGLLSTRSKVHVEIWAREHASPKICWVGEYLPVVGKKPRALPNVEALRISESRR